MTTIVTRELLDAIAQSAQSIEEHALLLRKDKNFYSENGVGKILQQEVEVLYHKKDILNGWGKRGS